MSSSDTSTRGGGLNLDQFLTHGDGGGKRAFLGDWKKDKEIVIWHSTRAQIAYASWVHPFQYIDTRENEKTGDEEEYLRFDRFVSPDPEIVHKSQFFRETDDTLQVPPAMDPFLLLREYLRLECGDMPLDTVVFEWENPRAENPDNRTIRWRLGHLTRLEDRGKQTFGHSLDTKLEYLFVIVADADPGKGPQITRGPKLLGEKIKKAIREQMKSEGDAGNPMIQPYAFKWEYNEKANMNDMYAAFRYNRAKLTETIRAAIMTDQFPDPTRDTVPRPGDKAKIRAAMHDAMRIDLPLDRFFVKEWVNEGPTEFNFGANRNDSKPEEKKAETRTRTPDVKTGAEPEPGRGRTRRRKVEEKPPEPETMPCDECKAPMLLTDTQCKKCGARYELEPDAPAAPAQTSKAAPAKAAATGATKCWSCGSQNISDDGHCKSCGIDVNDDIPL